MGNVIKVGMADLKTTDSRGVLTTLGLGSCIGISLYDPIKKIAGMAHIMLPDSKQIKNNSNKAKFADTAVDVLIAEMLAKGAQQKNFKAKLAGGAQMFSFGNGGNDIMKIGYRNAIAAEEKLKSLNIPVISKDVGGTYGRTIELYGEDGRLFIKTIGHGTQTI